MTDTPTMAVEAYPPHMLACPNCDAPYGTVHGPGCPLSLDNSPWLRELTGENASLRQQLGQAEKLGERWALRAATACSGRDEARDGRDKLAERLTGLLAAIPYEFRPPWASEYEDDGGAVPGHPAAAWDGLPGEREQLVARLNEATAENEKLAEEGRRLEKVVRSHARVMYAALVDVVHGDPGDASAMLTEQLDGYDGPQWNGTETGAEYLERAREAAEGRRHPEATPPVRPTADGAYAIMLRDEIGSFAYDAAGNCVTPGCDCSGGDAYPDRGTAENAP